MADPRGRGFNRGKGRWHAPKAQPIVPVNPVNLGWSQIDNEQKWYIGNTFLEPCQTEPGFIMIQQAIIGGIKRVHKMFVSNGMLARVTDSVIGEDTD